jgi:uncharacterized protein (TIGR00255 family)
VNTAIEDLEKMRGSEGEMLKPSSNQGSRGSSNICRPSRRRPHRSAKSIVSGLTRRIADMLSKSESQIELDQGRLAQEIAFLSDRADISEEIARLRTHIEHFRTIMDEEKEVGKRLDFLTQELNREANTITSKTNNMIVKEHALAIKSEIEKIREQVQNVE